MSEVKPATHHVMSILWMGLLWHFRGGDRVLLLWLWSVTSIWLWLSPSNTPYHIHTCIDHVRSLSEVHPWACHPAGVTWTLQRLLTLTWVLLPFLKYDRVTETSWPWSTWSGRRSFRLPSVTSSLIVLPVILFTMFEFEPFSVAHTDGVSLHASEPYVSMKHTLDLYILIRKFCVDPCYPIYISETVSSSRNVVLLVLSLSWRLTSGLLQFQKLILST